MNKKVTIGNEVYIGGIKKDLLLGVECYIVGEEKKHGFLLALEGDRFREIFKNENDYLEDIKDFTVGSVNWITAHCYDITYKIDIFKLHREFDGYVLIEAYPYENK